jgi:hypothetical protein
MAFSIVSLLSCTIKTSLSYLLVIRLPLFGLFDREVVESAGDTVWVGLGCLSQFNL